MSREIPEWRGKTDDTPAPPRVRLRIFERHNGVCYLSGRRIAAGEPWDLDHIKPLCLGGENRESNLAPALRDKHKEKTRGDVAAKAKSYKARRRNAGVKKQRTITRWRRFSGEIVIASRER